MWASSATAGHSGWWLMGRSRGRRDQGRGQAHPPSLLVVPPTGRDSATCQQRRLNLFKQQSGASGAGQKLSGAWGPCGCQRQVAGPRPGPAERREGERGRQPHPAKRPLGQRLCPLPQRGTGLIVQHTVAPCLTLLLYKCVCLR